MIPTLVLLVFTMNDSLGHPTLNRRRCLQSLAAMSLTAKAGVGLCDEPGSTVRYCTHEDTFGLLKQGKKIPVIFDTDIGSDIDDTWALLYLLKCPELDVRLVSVDGGSGPYRARLAAKFLTACDRNDIPLGICQGNPETLGHQRDWMTDYDLDTYKGEVKDDAVQAIINTIKQSKDPVTLVCVGPVPNIAAALKKDPSIVENSRFVGMHGSIKLGYGGSKEIVAEANVRSSPVSLQKVFAAPWGISITPLDTCGLLDLRGDRYKKIVQSSSKGIAELMENYKAWLTRVPWLKVKPDPAKRSSTLFDLVAVTMAFTEEHLNMEPHPVRVTDEGMTLIDESARIVRAAMSWKDIEAYQEHLVDRLVKSW